MSVHIRSAYRSVLREIAKSSKSARTDRNKDITRHIRLFIEDGSTNTDEKVLRDVRNSVTFLRSQRKYQKLLDRYNPLHDMSQEERIQATARRVGLDMPMEGQSGNSNEK